MSRRTMPMADARSCWRALATAMVACGLLACSATPSISQNAAATEPKNSALTAAGQTGLSGATDVAVPTAKPVAASADTLNPLPENGGPGSTQHGVWASRHLVATGHPLASQAARDILRAGGSAVDAAIAAQMVLTLVEPHASGIGGGLFLMTFDGQRVRAFDGRETAPSAATPELFMRNGKPMSFRDGVVGGRSVGVPGVLRALELAHRQHGRLPWARLFEPAISLARQGFAISPRLAAILREPVVASLAQNPAARAYFFNADGSPKAEGSLLRNPDLADTLERVASDGAKVMYEGALAEAIAQAVQSHPTNPGSLSESDLASYRAREREPLCFDYQAHRICGMPPPSSGTIAIAQMLGMLAGKNLAQWPPQQRGAGGSWQVQADAVHWFSEAGRLAYADRNRYVADTDYAPLPGGSPAALIAPEYLAQRAALMGPRSMGRAQPGVPVAPRLSQSDDQSPEFAGTSQVSIVDGYGHAVSMTTTIEFIFGSQIMVKGFMLNNELTDFSFVPEEGGALVANRVQGGKRPRSSMVPLLVFDRRTGELEMSLGSPGGAAIINYVAKLLVATLDWGLHADDALALANFGSRNGPTEIEAERTTPALADALRQRGHEVQAISLTSGAMLIERRTRGGQRLWFGGADPRREGLALAD